MWQHLYDKTWKKLTIAIVIVSILLSCVTFFKWNQKNEEELKAKTEQSFNQANEIIKSNEETFELMYEYVRRHVPYYTTAMAEDELVTKIIRDIIREVQSEHAEEEEHAAGEESGNLEDEQLVYLSFQLQEALLNEDPDEFMSVFHTNAYADFVYQFDSAESLEEGLNELMSKITLNDSFESLTYKRNKRVNNQIDFTLYFNNGREHKWSLNTVKLQENHSHNDDVEVFSTKFDDLLKNLK